MKVLSAPLAVVLSVTNKCNLSCKHCLTGEISAQNELTLDEITKLIQEMGRLKVFSVDIFGGEPLMRKDLFLIIEVLKRYQIQISMNTNGTLITKDIAKKLRDFGIGTLCISLDGGDEKVAEAMRGKGSFRKTLKGIENAYSAKIPVTISTTVTKYNFNDLRNIAILGKRLKVSGVRFNHVFYTGNAICYLRDIWLSLEDEIETLRTVDILFKEFSQFISGSFVQTNNILRKVQGSIRADSTNENELDTITVGNCGAGTTKCAIRADGWVLPCELLWEVRAGNIRDSSLSGIWLNSKIMQEFRQPMQIPLDNLPELQCRTCANRSLCFKGHRCYPYFFPGGIKDTYLYCLKKRKIS